MKYLVNVILYVMIITTGMAQASKVELLDLVKELAADSMVTNNTSNWPKAGNQKSIKWKSYVPKKEGVNYELRGTAPVVLKGKIIKCRGMDSDEGACKWDIILSGKKNGYTYFTVSADNLHIASDTDMIDYFFGKNKVVASLIEKDIESSLFWNYKFRLQMPGKKDLWMKITYECRTATAGQAENNDFTDGFYIDFFQNQKDLNDPSL